MLIRLKLCSKCAMLEVMNTNTWRDSVVVKAILVAVALLFGLGGIFYRSSGDKAVVHVGPQSITGAEIQIYAARRKIHPMYAVQILISKSIAEQEAHSLNMIVSDNKVADSIKQIPEFQDHHRLFSYEKMTSVLKQADMSYEAFQEDLKKRLMMQQLFALVSEVDVPMSVAYAALQGEKQMRAGVMYEITPTKITVSNNEVKKYFEANRELFMTPTYTYGVVAMVPDANANELIAATKEGQTIDEIKDSIQSIKIVNCTWANGVLMTELPREIAEVLKTEPTELEYTVRKNDEFAWMFCIVRKVAPMQSEFNDVQKQAMGLLKEKIASDKAMEMAQRFSPRAGQVGNYVVKATPIKLMTFQQMREAEIAPDVCCAVFLTRIGKKRCLQRKGRAIVVIAQKKKDYAYMNSEVKAKKQQVLNLAHEEMQNALFKSFAAKYPVRSN